MLPPQAERPDDLLSPPRSGRAAIAWAGPIVVTVAAGFWLRELGWIRIDDLPPLYARPRWPSEGIIPAAALGVALVIAVSRLARACPWRWLPAAGWAAGAGWAVALAASDGLDAVAAPLREPTDYLAGLPAMGDDPLGWLRGFAGDLPAYPTHVKGHPPLPMLILWGMARLGPGGAGWAAALIIVVGSSAVAAVAIALRRLAGEAAARRALPFLALAPYAVWVATSMDALFLGIAAWGVALLALACTGTRPVTCAMAAGLLLGALPYLSYGLLPLAAVPLAVLVIARPPRRVLVALGIGLAAVPVAFTLAGFRWYEGVAATHAAWASGAGAHRPYIYFVAGNLAVLALMTGPAAARALAPNALALARRSLARPFDPLSAARALARRSRARAHPRPGWAVSVLVGAALAGVLALDVTGVTRGEVERIWLPYAVWIMAATALPRTPGRDAGPLLAQVAVAVVLQAFVRSPW